MRTIVIGPFNYEGEGPLKKLRSFFWESDSGPVHQVPIRLTSKLIFSCIFFVDEEMRAGPPQWVMWDRHPLKPYRCFAVSGYEQRGMDSS